LDFLVILFALVLTAVHYFSGVYSKPIEKWHSKIISFSAGLFIAFIFLYILPEVFAGVEILGDTIFLLLLLGFVIFHVAEKYIYQHVKNKDEMLKDLAGIHTMGFFLNHFVVGMLLYFSTDPDKGILGILVFLPLLLHTLSSSLSLNHIDRHFNSRPLSILIAFSPVFGALFAMLLQINVGVHYTFYSFAIGALLYIVVRDMLPQKGEGKPIFFIIGLVISAILIFGINGLSL